MPRLYFDWELRVHLPLHHAPSWYEAVLGLEQGVVQLYWYPHLGMMRAGFFTGDAPDVIALRDEAEKLGGFLVVERAPVEMKTPELVWGKPHGDFALMKKLKQSFDAANVSAPGRFIGGL
jgi:hypothetical protein